MSLDEQMEYWKLETETIRKFPQPTYIECDCHAHAIRVEFDFSTPHFLSLCVWEAGKKDWEKAGKKYKKKEIKRWIKQIKKKGHPYTDMALISYEDTIKLRDMLTEALTIMEPHLELARARAQKDKDSWEAYKNDKKLKKQNAPKCSATKVGPLSGRVYKCCLLEGHAGDHLDKTSAGGFGWSDKET